MDSSTAMGKPDRASGTVPLTVTHAGATITRKVNACFKADGTFDRKATKARVDAVARALRHKIEHGHIAPLPG